MPRKPWPFCLVTGCPNRTPSGKCDAHRAESSRQRDRNRPSAHERGYNHEWQRIRAVYLYHHPLCESTRCATLPPWQRPPATDVDHIDGQGPRGNNDWGNLQALCHPCHSHKTATHDGGFGRQRHNNNND